MAAVTAQGKTESAFYMISLCVSEQHGMAKHILSMYGKNLTGPSFRVSVLRWLNVGVLFCLLAVGLYWPLSFLTVLF